MCGGPDGVLRRQRVAADRVVEVGLEGTPSGSSVIGRGWSSSSKLGHVRGYLLGLRGHGGTHLGEHLGGRVGRRGTGRGADGSGRTATDTRPDAAAAARLAAACVSAAWLEDSSPSYSSRRRRLPAADLYALRASWRGQSPPASRASAPCARSRSGARRMRARWNIGDGDAGRSGMRWVGQERDEQGARTPPRTGGGRGGGRSDSAEQAARRVGRPGSSPSRRRAKCGRPVRPSSCRLPRGGQAGRPKHETIRRPGR